MNQSLQSNDRQIRVFISSTFRDMQAERDILIKRIFPQLRKLSEERAVTWTEVDLRWGITDEQKAEGKVLPLCLEEIQRCRPYFIGLLGERYGWVPEPNSIPAELLEVQPWLNQHLQQSVTELEILHGVFNEEPMHGHAYFYFRNPKYLESVPTEKRQDFTAENAEAAAKLAKLKQKIRGALDEQVCELRENYANPEQLGEWILEGFTKLIDRLYPKDQTPDPLDQEAARHEAYARSRRLAFVGREELLRRLNEHCTALSKPLVLTGESGCGKSALVAEWVVRWRKDHPDDLIIQHYIGSTPDSADWQGLVRRILSELKRAFVITDDIPLQPDALRSALNDWTVKAAGSRRVVLVLDALNQLADDGEARQLGWLSLAFPANFRVIVSTLPGESFETLRKRGWPEMNVPLFAQADIAPAAVAYFKIFSKTPPPDLVVKLEATPAACNALYLRAVLDELRQFGIYEALQAKAANYLSAPDLPELFDRILTRWHDDFGKNPEHPDLVRRSLCLIACARFGLSETELLGLLGNNGEPLPRRFWTPCYLAAGNALVLRAGLLSLGHDYLRVAVRKRWLEDQETICSFCQQLEGYFVKCQETDSLGLAYPSNRKLDELPTLLRDLKQWDKLKDLLENIPTFLRLRESERWKNELHGFWIPLRQHYDPGEVYRAALVACEDTTAEQTAFLDEERKKGRFLHTTPTFVTELVGHSEILSALGTFLYEAADYRSAELFYRRALDMDEASLGHNHPKIAERLSALAVLLLLTNRTSEAGPLLERAVAIDRQTSGSHKIGKGIRLYNFAHLMQSRNQLVEAESLLRQVLEMFETPSGENDLQVANTLSSLGLLYGSTNRLSEAEPLLRRALAIRERSYGRDHPDVGRDCGNLGNLLRVTDRMRESEPLLRRALAIIDRTYGDHPHLSLCLANLAALLQDTNRPAEAERLLQRALEIDEQCHGFDHPEVATDLSNLAALLMATRRLAEAEPLLRRALAIKEQSFGADHPEVAIVLNNLSSLLWETLHLDEAEPMLRRALTIDERSYGPSHPNIAIRLNNLFGLLRTRHRLEDAEPLLRRAVAINEQSYGPDHPEIATTLCNLGGLLRDQGRLDEAEPVLRRGLIILLRSSQKTGRLHQLLHELVNHYGYVLTLKGIQREEIQRQVLELGRKFGVNLGS